MLLDILYFCVFSYEKGVYTVVLRLFAAAVVYAAAGYYGDIGAVADYKIIVNKVGKSRFAYDYRYMNRLVFSTGLDYYIYPRIIRF